MSTIGPAIPPHLLNRNTAYENDDDGGNVPIGPKVPPLIEDNKDEDEDDYAPALPPDMVAALSAKPSTSDPSTTNSSASKRIVGASLLSRPSLYDPTSTPSDDDDDDDDFGPKPLPAGVKLPETNAVTEFMEREERRRKNAEEAAKPKKLKREEWMLVPPSSSDLLGGLDPTKLKARQFSRSTAPVTTKVDNSLWTETPAERQQRLADEVSGKKRRAVDSKVDEETDETKRRRMDEEIIRKGVDRYTKKLRGPALLDQHAASGKVEASQDKESVIWDHSRDMSLGGRLMDDTKRSQIIKESRGLGDRFGVGKSGGFL